MIERHIDELDAIQSGDSWLETMDPTEFWTFKETMVGVNGGMVKSIWYGPNLMAYYVIMRDQDNWSVLVKHDLRNL